MLQTQRVRRGLPREDQEMVIDAHGWAFAFFKGRPRFIEDFVVLDIGLEVAAGHRQISPLADWSGKRLPSQTFQKPSNGNEFGDPFNRRSCPFVRVQLC
jgi:hypothetical protein